MTIQALTQSVMEGVLANGGTVVIAEPAPLDAYNSGIHGKVAAVFWQSDIAENGRDFGGHVARLEDGTLLTERRTYRAHVEDPRYAGRSRR